MLIARLHKASVFLRVEIERARQEGARLKAEGPIPDEVKMGQLDTMDSLAAFVQDPQNSRVVSLAAVQAYLGDTWAWPCGSPGTVEFLNNMQCLALGEESGLAIVHLEHRALSTRTLLAALNFSHFEHLKMVSENTDHNWSSWACAAELRKRRNAVIRDLQATGRGVLVKELIRCNFRVENWFPSAPCSKTTAHIMDTGPVARDLRTLLTGIPGVRHVAGNESTRSQSGRSAAISEYPRLAVPLTSEMFWLSCQANSLTTNHFESSSSLGKEDAEQPTSRPGSSSAPSTGRARDRHDPLFVSQGPEYHKSVTLSAMNDQAGPASGLEPEHNPAAARYDTSDSPFSRPPSC